MTTRSPWRPMSRPPSKTGKYFVGHRGTQGTAHYFHPHDTKRYRNILAGWYDLPDWKPTHWIPIPEFPKNTRPKFK